MKTPYEKLLEAATPLPWKAHPYSQEWISYHINHPVSGDIDSVFSIVKTTQAFRRRQKKSVALMTHSANMLPKALEALKLAQCECSPKERLSGHKSGCWMPEIQEAIRAIENPDP